jgi:hypothetical protein
MASITIASVTVPNWQGNTAGIVLRIYFNEAFTAASGTIYPKTVYSNAAGVASLGTFYQTNACTVTGTSLEIPAITLDSTTDSPDNPGASYSAVLWDSTTGKPIQPFGTFRSFVLDPTHTSATWSAIFAASENDNA